MLTGLVCILSMFVMPFAALDYGSARLAWLLAHFALVLGCAGAAWRLLGGPPSRRALAWGWR